MSRTLILGFLLMVFLPCCQTQPLSTPGESERKILAGYQQDFPVAPDGPNYMNTHRVVVTLKLESNVLFLLRELNGRYFPQQWCLMPNEQGRLRMGIDLAHDADRDALIETLGRELKSARSVQSGMCSPYLDRVLGPNEWRNAPNFPPFVLLADHVTEGTPRSAVLSLLGEASKVSPDSWHYEVMVGPHAFALIDIHFTGDRTTACEFRTRFQGPPRLSSDKTVRQ